MRGVRRERWSWQRAVAVGSALISFYVSYMAYRNLKGVVPLLRPGDLFDRQLAEFERGLFGADPAALLHSLLGTGVQTQILSVIYVVFIVLLPLSLALALVFSRDVPGGLFYATALSINWPLGAASYFLIPALGPIYAAPASFADLPDSKVTYLQGVLLDQRVEYLRDPVSAEIAQSIAAFASVHISMIFTAALAAHLLGLARRLRIGLWILLALTTGDHLSRLALRRRRRRRGAHRAGRARARARAHRLQAAQLAPPAAGTCRSPTKGAGWRAWCEGTAPTTRCPTTSRRYERSVTKSPASGDAPSGAAASAHR